MTWSVEQAGDRLLNRAGARLRFNTAEDCEAARVPTS
jgi:hypothetical protein